jgi:fructose-bisphosphate aldolase class I
MFGLIHQMRSRIITCPCFGNGKVIGATCSKRTMDGEANGKPVPQLLWERGVVPFLKVDKGLADEADGVQLSRIPIWRRCSTEPTPGDLRHQDALRIKLANPSGIASVDQQFAEAKRILPRA